MTTTAKERMQAALMDPGYRFTATQVQWLIAQAAQDAEDRARKSFRFLEPPQTEWQQRMRTPRDHDFMGGPVASW